MDNQDRKMYNWLVKRGSILLYENGDTIHFELDKDGSGNCLFTKSDTEELISILTSLARDIWERPGFVREPYVKHLYTVAEDGAIYWDIDQARLSVRFNAEEGAVEIDYSGDAAVEVPINCAVEVIQIMSRFAKQF